MILYFRQGKLNFKLKGSKETEERMRRAVGIKCCVYVCVRVYINAPTSSIR